MQHVLKIKEVFPVTHDVKCFRLEKPKGFVFLPGQATDLSVNKPGMEEDTRPFTFTALASKPYLEFTIKRYADHHGVTDLLHRLQPGDELIVREPWGAISYKGTGYFIAGGAGITPFMAIFRNLYDEKRISGNKLIFSNKTAGDIIYEDELLKMLGTDAKFILTRDKKTGYESGRIDQNYIAKQVSDFKSHFYVCGPDPMVSEIAETLQKMGASVDSIVFEK
jgi:ferredoxin-NADP reductase